MKELGKSAHKLKSSIDLFKVNSLHQDIRTLLELGRSNKQNDSIPGLVEKINDVLETVFLQLNEEKEQML